MSKPNFPYEFVDVIDLETCGDYRLFIRFSNDAEGEHDFADLIAEGGPMVRPLRDPAYFARVFLDHGIPTWPNGFDLDAINPHHEMSKAGELRRDAAEQRG